MEEAGQGAFVSHGRRALDCRGGCVPKTVCSFCSYSWQGCTPILPGPPRARPCHLMWCPAGPLPNAPDKLLGHRERPCLDACKTLLVPSSRWLRGLCWWGFWPPGKEAPREGLEQEQGRPARDGNSATRTFVGSPSSRILGGSRKASPILLTVQEGEGVPASRPGVGLSLRSPCENLE